MGMCAPGRADVSKKYVARMRLSMLGRTPDLRRPWVGGTLPAPAAASLVGQLRVADKVRKLVDADTGPTVYFDRSGWSPKLSRSRTRLG
jgi:hypothetical protein